MNVAGTLLLLWSLRRFEPRIERAPQALALLGLALLLFFAGTVILRAGPPEGGALMVLWVLLGAGAGEEVFFRGYVQSRLNESFGRPWCLLGVQLGPGLFGAAFLFGLVHVLNSADYFGGTYRFMWWHGLAAGSTLFYGFLRERTGSVLAPVLVHGLSDLLARAISLLR